MLDTWNILKGQEPTPGLSNEQLKAAIDHLANALDFIESIATEMNGEAINSWRLSMHAEACWNELNKCRIYTERILFIEEVIVPAMGEVYDAKAMFDSLIAWKLGMTAPAARSILRCLGNAEQAIRQCADELVSWLSPAASGFEGEDPNDLREIVG